MGDKSCGLYPDGKFIVQRRDGADRAGGKHEGCKYFVLDVTDDPHAIPALRAYSHSARSDGYELLADDLDAMVAMVVAAPASTVAPQEQSDEDQPEHDGFHCEQCEATFFTEPHATDDGYWLCGPCWKGLQSELKTHSCTRAFPCRYPDARQCARDTMLGSECPKVCDCACHAPASPAAPASSDAWATWFDRLGKKASAEVVNATAELVTNERLAALVQAKVLPGSADIRDEAETYFAHAKTCAACGPEGFCSEGLRLYNASATPPSTRAKAAAEEIRQRFLPDLGLAGALADNAVSEITSIILKRCFSTEGEDTK